MEERNQTAVRLVSNDLVIHFAEGLIGFSELKDFVLQEQQGMGPFRLLQSLEAPQVGFLVVEACNVISNYYDSVPTREWEALGVHGKTKPLALVIVVVGSSPKTSTGNFQAPLLVNHEKMLGKQVILTEAGFSVRRSLF